MDASKHAPHRNDIWWTRLTDAAVGLEMGAEQKIRPCVVVSADWLNARRPYVVVVPLTHYSDGKEATMARWAASIHPVPHRSGHTFKPNSNSAGWESSIIDAAQLWTVHHDDIVWDDPRGSAELSSLADGACQ